jgi:hypothetical protein
VNEKKIIVQNYDHIHGKKTDQKTNSASTESKKSAPKPENNQTETANNQNQETQKESFIDSTAEEKSLLPAPVQSKDQNVSLQVKNIKLQDGAIVLDVNLKNDGQKAVRFLYSFLDVRDDQGSLLSAITDGLPGELPANGEAYEGKIRIPTALLSSSKTISLSLTDYPDQKLQLKLENLPVTSPEASEETPTPEETPSATEE